MPRRQVVGPGTVSLAVATLIGWVGGRAHAHGPESHADTPAASWSTWNPDPLILLSLTILSALYIAGLTRMWRRAGDGRGVSRTQALSFTAAIVALVIALVSPVDVMSDELGWAHMVQHMTLMMVAAPLFVLGAPAMVMLWALPERARRVTAHTLAPIFSWRPSRYLLWQPVAMWSLYAVTLWIWHLPVLYEAALRSRWVHEFQHLTFFITSCLFWRVLIDPLSRLVLNRGLGVLYLFTTSLHATLLGVFMALAPRPWYSDYVGRTTAWNLSALQDQQIAGFIMWMPACMIYAIVAAAIFALWIHEPEEPSAAAAQAEGGA